MRKFRKVGITFPKKLLKELSENENSCVSISTLKHHIALHPFHLSDFKVAIKDILSKGTAKYKKELGGILLGYDNVKLLTPLGLINNDACFIHIDIQADFYLFKPEVGKELKGVVTKKTKDHVSSLLYNAFNISLPKKEDEENWLGHRAQIGQEILFRITHINLKYKFPHIKGEIISLVSDDSGISTSEECAVKPNKKILFDDCDEQETVEENVKSKKKEKKKSKKRKLDEEATEDIQVDDKAEIEETPKIKRRRLESLNADEEKSSVPDSMDEFQQNHISDLSSSKHKKHKKEKETEDKPKKKKKKKDKIKKEKKEEDDDSLGELNIESLFNSQPYDLNNSKKIKISTDGIELPPDSDLDSLLGSQKSKRKRKNTNDFEENVKKIKKSNSDSE